MSATLASTDVKKAGVILACERSVGRHTISVRRRGRRRGGKEKGSI